MTFNTFLVDPTPLNRNDSQVEFDGCRCRWDPAEDSDFQTTYNDIVTYLHFTLGHFIVTKASFVTVLQNSSNYSAQKVESIIFYTGLTFPKRNKQMDLEIHNKTFA